MKALTYLLASTAAALLFTACSGNSAESASNASAALTASSAAPSSPSAPYDASCFEAFDYDYRQLLTKEDILKHVLVSNPDAIEVIFNERPIETHNEYRIEWASDRPDVVMSIKAGPTSVEIPKADKNIVTFQKISFKKGAADKALQDFDRAYGQLPEEEYRQMEARIDEQYRDKSEEERNTMKSLIRTREGMAFQPVANVGSGAYWMSRTTQNIYLGVELHVLAGTVEFQIDVKVSADDKENARIAALLAQEVLAKCQG